MITIAKQKKSYYNKGDVASEIVGLIEYSQRIYFSGMAGKVFLWKQRLISERYIRIKSAVFYKVFE